MNLYETRKATDAAEARARSLEAEIAARGAVPDATVEAKTWAECAELTLEHASEMSRLIPATEYRALEARIEEQGDALLAQLLDGEISLDASLASLERLEEQGVDLWFASHCLAAWQDGVRDLEKLIALGA